MSGSTEETALIWFRRDLRLHDNPTATAAATADEVVPVYCFDPRQFDTATFGGTHSFRFRKTGPHRVRFLRESVADLRQSLREHGSELVVRHGRPEEVLPRIAEAHDVETIYHQRFPTSEERAVADAVQASGTAIESLWTHTLHHIEDLPVPPAEIEDTFTPFRKRVEADSHVREPLDAPTLPSFSLTIEPGALPAIDELGVEPPPTDDRAVLPFSGGESAGIDRLESYVWEADQLREYKETRNGLLGADFSSKLSPWLNAGCLSPRRVHAAVNAYERQRVANDSTYWLLFELRWRDFFQFQFYKHGDQFFTRGGIRARSIDWREDTAAFRRWARGETGIPFVDAAMRELNQTGYQSNRARQNAASFLANNLRIDWRWGAAYFETQLVDYDPCSNYGNWAYIAGTGNDSRDRYFNIIKQARRYDGDAAYVTHWLPELAGLPPEYAHEPWTMDADDQARFGVELGDDYPEPMLDLEASYEKLR